MSSSSDHSEATIIEVDNEVREIIVNANSEAVNLLKTNEKHLHDLANLLLEKETVDSKELDELLGIDSSSDLNVSNDTKTEKKQKNEDSSWQGINPETTTAFSDIKD